MRVDVDGQVGVALPDGVHQEGARAGLEQAGHVLCAPVEKS